MGVGARFAGPFRTGGALTPGFQARGSVGRDPRRALAEDGGSHPIYCQDRYVLGGYPPRGHRERTK